MSESKITSDAKNALRLRSLAEAWRIHEHTLMAAQCVILETDCAGITDAYQFETGNLGQIILTLLRHPVIYCFFLCFRLMR
ncbi:hypothetical protein ACEQUB_p00166 (plasmid) [Ralstonia syzygii]|uniref:Uncharacterized protein n=1 Tax=Ralstonia syzygii R24 TaxID=907261 RepID=G3A9X9_9RALS|nr:hypothetical protein RALSY_mp10651 [Ralstonia syzygii R24]